MAFNNWYEILTMPAFPLYTALKILNCFFVTLLLRNNKKYLYDEAMLCLRLSFNIFLFYALSFEDEFDHYI